MNNNNDDNDNVNNDKNNSCSYCSKYWDRSNPPKFRRLLNTSTKNNNDNNNLQERRNTTRFVYISGLVSSSNNNNKLWYTLDPYYIMDSIRTLIINELGIESTHVEVFINKKNRNYCHLGLSTNKDVTTLINKLQNKTVEWTINTNLLTSTHDNNNDNDNDDITKIQSDTLFLDYADIEQPINRNDPKTGELPKSECTSITSHVVVPGLILLENFITDEEHDLLLATLTGPQAPWFTGQSVPTKERGHINRRVQHYGYVFDYETNDVLRDRSIAKGNCPLLPSINNNKNNNDKNDDDTNNNFNHHLEDYILSSVNNGNGWDALAGIIERVRQYNFKRSDIENQQEKQEQIERIKNDNDMDNNNETGVIDVSDKGGTTMERNNDGEDDDDDDDNNNDNGQNHHHHQQQQQQKQQQRQSERQQQQELQYQCYPNINQMTINEYKPGQGIGSHIDTISAFGDGLISISLNGGIVMEFRRHHNQNHQNESSKTTNNRRKLVYIPPRSLLLMSGPARYEWEHMIVSRSTDTVDGTVLRRETRVSLTLRTALQAPIIDKQQPNAVLPLPRAESSCFPPVWGNNISKDDCDITSKGDNDTNTSKNNILVTPDTERLHVHEVYDAIATQWHHTRGRRGVLWPSATTFIQSLEVGSIIADVGCGDGKYFSAIWNAGSYVIGTDISYPLLKSSSNSSSSSSSSSGLPESRQVSSNKQYLSKRPQSCVAVGDCMNIPMKSNSVDAVLCVAVFHHISTYERRVRCLEELIRICKPSGGLINIQAWSIDQDVDSKRKFVTHDVFVPFNAQPKYLNTNNTTNTTTTNNSMANSKTTTTNNNTNDDSNNKKKDDDEKVGAGGGVTDSNNNNSNNNNNNNNNKSVAEIYSDTYKQSGIAEYDDQKG